MTALVLAAVTMAGTLNSNGLPTRDPLNWWLYLWETSSMEMLPGVLPFFDERFPSAESPGGIRAEIAEKLFEKSAPPGTEPGPVLSWTVTGEVLHVDGTVETRGGATGRLFTFIKTGLLADCRLSLWTGSDELPPHHFMPFHQGLEKGRHLYVDWGYLEWNGGAVSAAFGRIPRRWGPGRFTRLLISDNSPPMDMLAVRILLGKLSFDGLLSSLNADSAIYLAAHRIDVKLMKNLRVGLSESILFKADGLEFAYMNPVIPWYPVQWNERLDDNAFLCIDAAWKPVSGLECYGEFLIDDIQYENDGNRPDKLGITAGTSFHLRNIESGGVLEYTRIDRYVYSQRMPHNYYLHHGDLIGSELGPDADRLTLSLGTSAAWPFLAGITLTRTRHGEGTVEEGWPDTVSAGGKFPSGIVEHTAGAEIYAGCYPLDNLEIHAAAGNEWIRNADHVTGARESRFRAYLEVISGF